MDTFLIYWNKFVQSNTFNFIVMLCILYWIAKKFNISGMLESFRSHVINSIKQAQANKEKAKLELNSAKDSIAGLEEKIVSAKLAAKTAKASAALSKKHIIDLLKANPELHKKFIEQSIQELG